MTPPDAAASERRPRVLVVDDDTLFSAGLARVLRSDGYDPSEAQSFEAAVGVVEDDGDEVDAVLCDVRLQGRSGIELLSALLSDHQDLAVVMTTGIDDADVAATAMANGAFGYLVKPFQTSQLLITLAGALHRRDLESARRQHLHTVERAVAATQVVRLAIDDIQSVGDDASVSVEDTIDRLSRAVSLRDEETGQHIARMSRYATVIARQVGYEGLSPTDLRLATALHDVGKIAVSDVVLLKPGPLSPEEVAAMRRHPQLGYQLLAGSSSKLLRVAASIALGHHEWWDGSGYPNGVEGEAIPEEARIAAVADVFDALTSDRVYRPGFSVDAAYAEIAELSGRQFEPRLVAALVATREELAAISAEHPEADVAERIRLLVVDDHEMFAEGVARMLGTRPELKVVATVGTMRGGIDAAMRYQPDVVLMDFGLPDGDGVTGTQQIKLLVPGVKVLMLTGRDDQEALVAAMAAGCSGFVRKEETVDTLVEAVLLAFEGEIIQRNSEVIIPLLGRLTPTRRGLGSDLTPREVEVLRHMATGAPNKQIARTLQVSLNTVRNHAQKILVKLEAHSKLEAVSTAVREGLIGYPSSTRTA